MLNAMVSYTVSLLQAIASFMGSEPMIYLFGTIVALFVFKLFLSLTNIF